MTDLLPLFLTFVIAIVLIFRLAPILASSLGLAHTARKPACIPDTIPFLSNTYQNLVKMGDFLDRAIPILREKRVVMFHLGPKTIYWIAGPDLVQKLFTPNPLLSANLVPRILQDKLWAMPKDELRRFANDLTGRSSVPKPGTISRLPQQRLWYTEHQIYAKFLTDPTHSNLLAQRFFALLKRRLDSFSMTEWSEVRLFDLMKDVVPESAIVAVLGPRILELNPGLIEAIWDLDSALSQLVWGLPRFLIPGPYRARDRVHGMAKRYLESAWESFEWDGPDAKSDWEVHFGARVSREVAKWLKDTGFSMQTASGHTTARLLGLNSNSVPSVVWSLFDVIQRPDLLRAARAEAMEAITLDEATGERTIDKDKLLRMPLLQAICLETLRLRTSYNLTREVTGDVSIGGYRMKRGSLIQAPTTYAHLDDSSWAVEGHDASEFWPERHIRYENTVDEAGVSVRRAKFVMKGRPSSFYPFGGGEIVCPGRHFARQQIIINLAIVIAKFDIELVEWTDLDGAKSDRPAHIDKRASGMVVLPPDRDLKIRWRRLW